jgi:hypothetical protein
MELFQFGSRKIRKNTIFIYGKKYYQPNLKGSGGFCHFAKRIFGP